MDFASPKGANPPVDPKSVTVSLIHRQFSENLTHHVVGLGERRRFGQLHE